MRVRLGVEQNNIDDFINKIIFKYHFDKKDAIDLKRTYLDMVKLIDAKAVYKINQHVTGVKEIDDNQSAVVAMTLGDGIDRMQEDMIKEQRIAEAYMMDCIADELLLLLYKEFNKTYARYHRRYVKKYVFIGEEVKLEAIPDILDDLYATKDVREKIKTDNIEIESKKKHHGKSNKKDSVENNKIAKTAKSDSSKIDEVNLSYVNEVDKNDNEFSQEELREIKANQYGNMVPIKSVLFYAILTENPEEVCEGICIGCNNLNCENRVKVAAYEKEKMAKLGIEVEENPTQLNYGYQRIFSGNK